MEDRATAARATGTCGPGSTIPLRVELPFEEIAGVLAQHPSIRVLSSVSSERPCGIVNRKVLLSGCAIHATMGGAHGATEMVRLAFRGFLADEGGTVREVGSARCWTDATPLGGNGVDHGGRLAEEGSEPLCDAELSCLLRDAEFVVVHGARQVRAALEERFPSAAGLPWICTSDDVEWDRFGLEAGSLMSLSLQSGRFYDRRSQDGHALALIHLLERRDDQGSSVLHAAMSSACRPTSLVEVPPVALEREALLVAAGYDRRVGAGAWWREVASEDIDREIEWLMWEVCGGADRPTVRAVTWRSRHRTH